MAEMLAPDREFLARVVGHGESPGVVVVRDGEEVEAGRLGADRLVDERARAVAFPGEDQAHVGHVGAPHERELVGATVAGRSPSATECARP
jgi:hypothetical protein